MTSPNEIFLNEPIEVSGLPRLETLPTQPIEPSHAWLGLATRWSIGLVLLVASLVVDLIGLRADGDVTPALLLAIASGVMFLLGVTTWLHRRSIRFGLRSHDFALEKGVLWRSQTVQPLCRVQHVELEQGPIEKRLGIATLSLYSAGTAAASFQVPGVQKPEAEQMRSVVLSYTNPETT